jgi:CRP-like cAMP-binding protein
MEVKRQTRTGGSMRTLEDRQDWESSLAEVMMFQTLSVTDRKDLLDTCEILFFDSEELVIQDGDLSPSFFVVLDGTVKVHVMEDDKDVYICSLGKGATFGESSLFTKMPRTANVTALDPSILLKLTRYDLMDFIRQHPMAGNRMLLVVIYQLMRKLREANRELAYERRSDSDQAEIDALIADLAGGA